MSVATDRASKLTGDTYLRPLHLLRVEQQQSPDQRLTEVHDDFERLGSLCGADDADQGREDTHGRTHDFIKLLIRWKQAGITGRAGVTRIKHADLPVKRDSGTRDQRHGMLDASLIHGVASGEVVTAVEHNGGGVHQLRQSFSLKTFLDGDDLDLRINLLQGLPARLDLGLADALCGVQNLTLQVGEVHLIIINQRNLADTCASEVKRGGRPEATGTDNERMCLVDFLLSIDADLIEQDMA